MTDNEIIKALESAIHRYKDTTHHVSCIVDINILKETLKFVQRQKAEIERLHDSVLANAEAVKALTKELKIAKSEAIKEFAERLKEKASRGFWDELAYADVDDIDNLVKEMTEVQK